MQPAFLSALQVMKHTGNHRVAHKSHLNQTTCLKRLPNGVTHHAKFEQTLLDKCQIEISVLEWALADRQHLDIAVSANLTLQKCGCQHFPIN